MLTQDIIKSYLDYNSKTGIFTWLKCQRKDLIGKVAGSKDPDGYIRIRLLGKGYGAHRLAWIYVYGSWPEDQLDHINRSRDDNRILNLREVNHRENHKNVSTNKTGYVGVNWDSSGGKWVAYITVNSKRLHLGRFDTKSEAITARKEAETKHNFYGGQL